MANEKFYEKFTSKKSSKVSDAKNKRKEFNKQRDKFYDDKRRGLNKPGVAESESAGSSFSAEKTSEKQKKSIDAKILSSFNMFDSKKLPEDAVKVLENFDSIVQSVRPMNSRQLAVMPKDIRALSHQLTDERETRHTGYMNGTEHLSAYLRYFTWWNLVRLTRVFSNLPEEAFSLNDGDTILDIGSGPLTVVNALWLSRPELRNKKLTVFTMDISQSTMAVGEEIYMSIAAKARPSDENAEGFWRIVRVKGGIGTEIRKKAKFISCANMFNEIYQKDHEDPEIIADRQIQNVLRYADEKCSVFIAEPGMPVAGRFISLMRHRFISRDFKIAAPCPHFEKCSMNGLHARYGGSAKWCNFSFSTEDAPAKLLRLSDHSGLPKERAVISFIFATKNDIKEKENSTETKHIAIVSDPIRLPEHRLGFYSCCNDGMALVINEYGKKLKSGDILSLSMLKKTDDLSKDKKSHAIEIRV